MTNGLMLLIVSILPVFVIAKYIYSKDKEKEPFKLLLKLFFGGIGSCFLVLIVTFILDMIFPILSADTSKLNLIQLIFYVFVGVALVEEFCKWINVYFISYNEYEFDEFYDMIIYSTFVALGFAFFENLLYVYGGGLSTGISRALLAVPGHACDGVFMGYYLGLAKISSLNKNIKLERRNKFLSLLVPVLLHGIYDYCIFTNKAIFLLLFYVFVISVYIYSIKKIKLVSSINRKIKYKNNYCTICGHKVESNFCPICGRKNE